MDSIDLQDTEWEEIRYNTGWTRAASFYSNSGVGIEWRIKSGVLFIRGRAQRSSGSLTGGDIIGFLDTLLLPVSINFACYVSGSGFASFAIDSDAHVDNGTPLSVPQLRCIGISGTSSGTILIGGQGLIK